MRIRAITLFVVLISAGCAAQPRIVKVIDGQGRPVAGARVKASSPNFGYRPVFTNAVGEALLPREQFEKIDALSVDKEFYRPVWQTIGRESPVTITLRHFSDGPIDEAMFSKRIELPSLMLNQNPLGK